MTRITYRYNGRVTHQQAWPESGRHNADPDWDIKCLVAKVWWIAMAILFAALIAYALFPKQMQIPLENAAIVFAAFFFFVFMPWTIYTVRKYQNAANKFCRENPGWVIPKPDPKSNRWYRLGNWVIVLILIGILIATWGDIF